MSNSFKGDELRALYILDEASPEENFEVLKLYESDAEAQKAI